LVLVGACTGEQTPAAGRSAETTAGSSTTTTTETTPTTEAAPVDACAEREVVEADGPVVDSLLALFAETPIVAFGEHHGSTDEHRILQALVCDPRFADTVNDVVVEFGNQRLQDVIDRYIGGDDVSADELAQVWRESTQRSGVWEAPVYRQFFAVVRSINRGRSPKERVRVLAGDPPIDWSTITDTRDCDLSDPTCLEHWDREENYAAVVRNEVLNRDRTALLIAGAGHMTRRVESGPPPSIPQLLEADHPGAVSVVLAHDRFLRDDATAAELLASAAVPALVSLADSPLGALDLCLLDDVDGCATHTLADVADQYLFLGAIRSPRPRVEGRGETPVLTGVPIDPAELTGRIVFDDYEDVYSMRPDGTDLRAATALEGSEFDGDLSPDGRFIAYRDSRRGINDDDEIYVARIDGTEARNVTNDPANDWGPHWSPDGQWIAFNSDRDGGALAGYLVRPDGTNLTRLPIDVWFEYPSFSPDGTRVAFMGHGGSDYDIYVADVATGATVRLTDAPGADGWPAWSPDGATIAFTSERDDCARAPAHQDCWHGDEPGEHHDIWLMNADGSNQRRVTPEVSQFVAWSPDGRFLLISGHALFVVRPDGTGRHELRNAEMPLALGGLPDWGIAVDS
jgi:hypothetical protein